MRADPEPAGSAEPRDGEPGGDPGTLLFSYGSNMCRQRLLRRAPSARIRGPALLEGHALRFHKLSDVDGSGKADAHRTGDPGDRVWGVLARLSAADRDHVDEVEGVGVGYRVERAVVRTDDGRRRSAVLYRARRPAIRPGLRPFAWYLRLVVEGARQHGLPGAYVRRLAGTPSEPDPDRKRARRNLEVLG